MSTAVNQKQSGLRKSAVHDCRKIEFEGGSKMREWFEAIWKTLLIVIICISVIIPLVYVFSLFIGEDGYLTLYGQVYVFVTICGFGWNLLAHAFKHSLNEEPYHWYCPCCYAGRFLNWI